MPITVDYIVNGENLDEIVLNRPLQQLANGVDNTTYTAGTGLTLTNQSFALTDERYTTSEKTKLGGIAAGAQVNTVTSVNNLTGAVSLTFDNYQGWNLLTNGTSRGKITANENFDIRAGSNVSLVYSATNNAITINSTDTNTVYSGWDLLVNGSSKGSISSGENVNFIGGNNVSLAYSTTNNAITINADSGADTNYYLSGLSFATATGVLTATVNGTTNQSVDLDGRYLLSTATADNSQKLDGLDSTDFLQSNGFDTANMTIVWDGVATLSVPHSMMSTNEPGLYVVYQNGGYMTLYIGDFSGWWAFGSAKISQDTPNRAKFQQIRSRDGEIRVDTFNYDDTTGQWAETTGTSSIYRIYKV